MTTNLDTDTLKWAAQWIQDSLKGEADERVIKFGNNMAMTLRAAVQPAASTPTGLEADMNTVDSFLQKVTEARPVTYGEIDNCRQAIRRIAAAASTPTESPKSRVQCADCLAWIDRNASHTCRQQISRNRRSKT